MSMRSKTLYAKAPTLVLATRNPGKIKEFQAILEPWDVKVMTLFDFSSIAVSDEPFTTYLENAHHKATLVARQLHLPVLADDSGLEISALNDLPGVNSARFLPDLPSYEEKCKAILTSMESHADRRARFVASIAIVLPSGHHYQATRSIEGVIALSLSGAQGFGYDPIFIPQGRQQSFAELTFEEKNKISHRALATQAVMEEWMRGNL